MAEGGGTAELRKGGEGQELEGLSGLIASKSRTQRAGA